MSRKKTNFETELAEWLREPGNAALYLLEILSDRDSEMEQSLVRGLRHVVGAFGVAVIASKSGVSRQHLYKLLKGNTSPTVSTLLAILGTLGIELSVKSSQQSAASRPAKIVIDRPLIVPLINRQPLSLMPRHQYSYSEIPEPAIPASVHASQAFQAAIPENSYTA